MADLKPYLDRINKTADAVQLVAQEIDTLMAEGSDENYVQALELCPRLEKAEKDYDAAVALYERVQLAGRPNDIARNFIPVSSTPIEPGEGSQPTVIKRADYNKLSLVDRARFVKSGGTVED
jgi:hypothetical protein